MRHVDTFFRGHRRETRIEAATILCNKAGEKRLKLAMRIPLAGDQLVGMPSWVSEPFSTMAKADSAGKFWASEMELDPMLLHIFMLPETEREVTTFENVRMCGFKIEHDTDDPEHPSLALTFTCYVPRTGKALKFADDNFGSSLFVRYEAAQQSLLDDNPNVQPIDELKSKPKTTIVEDEEETDDDDSQDSSDDANGGDDDEEDDETHVVVEKAPEELTVVPQAARSRKKPHGTATVH